MRWTSVLLIGLAIGCEAPKPAQTPTKPPVTTGTPTTLPKAAESKVQDALSVTTPDNEKKTDDGDSKAKPDAPQAP